MDYYFATSFAGCFVSHLLVSLAFEGYDVSYLLMLMKTLCGLNLNLANPIEIHSTMMLEK